MHELCDERAPQHLGTRVAHEGVAPLLRLDGVVPVQPGLQQLGPAPQLEHLGVVEVRGAGLQERDLHGRVLAEAGGDHGSGGAPAHDDVVVGGHRVLGHLGSWAVGCRDGHRILLGHGAFFLGSGARGAERAHAGRGNQPDTAGSVFS